MKRAPPCSACDAAGDGKVGKSFLRHLIDNFARMVERAGVEDPVAVFCPSFSQANMGPVDIRIAVASLLPGMRAQEHNRG
jgi:hypothetical protein